MSLTLIALITETLPIVGIILSLAIWANSKFNLKSICVQISVMTYMFVFCLLYVSDKGQLIIDENIFNLSLRLLSLLGLICTSTHMYYLTRKLNEQKSNKRQNNIDTKAIEHSA